MEAFSLLLGCNTVRILRYGDGPECLIALHGYADHARMFAPLEPALGRHFSIWALDLPFHGETSWDNATFTQNDLLEVIGLLLQRAGVRRFSLMGFSFGARLALGMLPQLEEQVQRVLLLAPDGIQTRGMQWAVWTPMWLRKWIQSWMRYSGSLLQAVNFLRRLRILPLHAYRFVHQQLTSESRLRRAIGCWLAMADFKLEKTRLKGFGPRLQVYMGEDDPVLQAGALRKFCREIPGSRLFLIPHKGHRIIDCDLGAILQAEL